MLVQNAMHTQLVTINAQQTLPEAVILLQTLDVRRLLVLQDGCLVGLLTDGQVKRALSEVGTLRSAWDFAYRVGSRKVQEMMHSEVLTARPADDLNQAIRTMLNRHVGGLPVVGDAGSVVGLLTLTDVLRAVVAHPRPGLGTVRQHMSAEAVTVLPELPLSEAAARLVITRLRVLPVVRDQVLLGVLHEQDIRALMVRSSEAHGPTVMEDHFYLEGKTVAELMTPPTAEVSGDALLVDALEAMLAADVHGLPVVGDGHTLLGVITVRDILGALIAPTVHLA
ncbi:CBS domain-containing protein [Deinococcus oregonensis]|uniref:CBS domain-containing protein n=1 Tax=Deinococcus oregonensis TaxID=1805970 RepID=A0ABV6ASD5_9DEIO